MKATTAAVIIGIIFLFVGALGFVSNPIIYDSHEALFHANTTHNLVHITSGVMFLLFGLAIPGYVKGFMKFFGIVYFLLGIMGLVNFGTNGMGELLGFLHVNGPDNFLHIGLGLLIFVAGTLPVIRTSPGN